MQQPSNKLEHPISKLIEELQRLPVGTTYEQVDGEFWGGEIPHTSLGTGYQMRINIVEGFNPSRE